jgi:acylphosphatase
VPVVARHIRLSGRVQGVFYRAWTREQARELGLAGWVRNCSDNSVEAHLEGEKGAVEQMIERMRQGPTAARVDDISVEQSEPENARRFEVRH